MRLVTAGGITLAVASVSVSLPAQETSPAAVRSAQYNFGEADKDIPDGGVTVLADIIIDQRGRLLSCSVAESTGSLRLDAAVCDMFRKTARFKPAIKAGKPVPAGIHQRLQLISTRETKERGVPFPTVIDPPQDAVLTSAWVFMDDYPQDAMQARQEGDVAIRIWLDKAGKVERCEVQTSSGHPSLDDATCRLAVARARYPAPATGGSSPFVKTIRWTLPPERP